VREDQTDQLPIRPAAAPVSTRPAGRAAPGSVGSGSTPTSGLTDRQAAPSGGTACVGHRQVAAARDADGVFAPPDPSGERGLHAHTTKRGRESRPKTPTIQAITDAAVPERLGAHGPRMGSDSGQPKAISPFAADLVLLPLLRTRKHQH